MGADAARSFRLRRGDFSGAREIFKEGIVLSELAPCGVDGGSHESLHARSFSQVPTISDEHLVDVA